MKSVSVTMIEAEIRNESGTKWSIDHREATWGPVVQENGWNCTFSFFFT